MSATGAPCGCPAGYQYFDDVQACVPVTVLPPDQSPPNNPGDNGPPCTANPDNAPPCVGDPINPGSGNMWQSDVDYVTSGAPGKLMLARTYNSSPTNVDASVLRAFGTRWTQPYDAVLKPEAPLAQGTYGGTCYRREDTLYVWCSYPIVSASTLPDAVSIVRSGGRKYLFNRSGTSWVNGANVDDRLTATYNADNSAVLSWTYVSAQGDQTERYDANGMLISIATRAGAIQRLTYSNGITNDSSAGRNPTDAPVCSHVQTGAVLPAGRLLCATDNWGRQLQFEYDTKGRITKAIDPANRSYLYTYDGPSGGCPTPDTTNRACAASNLTQITYPDGKSRTYYYNEAAQINGGATCANAVVIGNGYGHLLNSMTGLVDENGAHHTSWTYSCLGQATSSQHPGGVEKTALAYAAGTNGASTTTVTHTLGDPANPLTTVRHYSYQTILGIPKNLGIDQPCVECGLAASRTYDGNGNLASRTDWNGNVTTYIYDLARNLETSRVEASGTPQARTTTTQWHASYRLPVVIAGPKRITTYDYDSAGNLQTKTAQATTDATGAQGVATTVTGTPRIWRYTYNAAGQVHTVTGPRTDVVDVTTYDYNGQGNLITITDAAQHVTTLSNYDGNGRVGRIVDPNGLTTDLLYWPRGWLKSKTVGSESTHYDYDNAGQLKTVTLPDLSMIGYTYDDAHCLTDIADSVGNSIHYTLDLRGNRLKEEVKDPSGVLARQTSRVYDALNRLQQVTGNAQ